MRRAPSLVALLLAALACGALAIALGQELRSAVPDASPAAAIHAAAASRADERDAAFKAHDRSFDSAFDPAMVRERSSWRMGGVPATLDLAVVNATPGADLSATARACARWAGAPRRRVQCYVFADTESYAFKNVTESLQATQPTALVILCWATMGSNPKPGEAVVVSDMRDAPQTWKAQGCPDSWIGTDAEAGS
jgi:Flp pilus assembly protein TadG